MSAFRSLGGRHNEPLAMKGTSRGLLARLIRSAGLNIMPKLVHMINKRAGEAKAPLENVLMYFDRLRVPTLVVLVLNFVLTAGHAAEELVHSTANEKARKGLTTIGHESHGKSVGTPPLLARLSPLNVSPDVYDNIRSSVFPPRLAPRYSPHLGVYDKRISDALPEHSRCRP